MTNPSFTVRLADWQQEGEALRHIRDQVFIQEQAVPKALEWDGEDESSLHVIAEDTEGNAIGTGRLLTSGQIGRMAVLPRWRSYGVGSALLNALLQTARLGNYPTIFLNAQIHAKAFYNQHGFTPVGEQFMEADIPHIRMELRKDHD
ncbi:MAG: GNAT family N-acetyltransferase [Chromatiales bacterium]|nr:GNAT family N-acetyltransferase [Chromatiales bacterium]